MLIKVEIPKADKTMTKSKPNRMPKRNFIPVFRPKVEETAARVKGAGPGEPRRRIVAKESEIISVYRVTLKPLLY